MGLLFLSVCVTLCITIKFLMSTAISEVFFNIFTHFKLFDFLKDDRYDVFDSFKRNKKLRLLAVQHVASLSATPEMMPHFKSNNCAAIRILMDLLLDENVCI